MTGNLTKLKTFYRENKQLRSRLFLILKVLITLSAIFFVLRKVSLREVKSLLISANKSFLFLSLLSFTLSKLASASRTLIILRIFEVPLLRWENIKLYWTGMAYNIFLPGGIGGDIYKTLIINNKYKKGIKISAGVFLMDRFSGVTGLIFLALALIPFTSLGEEWKIISILGLIITPLLSIILIKTIMTRLKGNTGVLFLWSLLVQILQIIAAMLILKSLNTESSYPDYLFIFLLSSLAAMLPVSIGGFGLRELVFLSVSPLLFLDQKIAVTTSFAFYLTTLLVSIVGLIPALASKGTVYNDNLSFSNSPVLHDKIIKSKIEEYQDPFII